MNQEEFGKIVDATIANIQQLLLVKGGEYASADDRLANFKRGSGLVGVAPLTVAFVYASKHYDAVANYVKAAQAGKQLSLSEPIEGRFDDLINYCILMKALLHENRGETPCASLPSPDHYPTHLAVPTSSERGVTSDGNLQERTAAFRSAVTPR